jgi:hypothetical protein
MNNTFKILTLCSSVALLLGTAQVAQAHSGFKDGTMQQFSMAGTPSTAVNTNWNGINVTHGCGDAAGKLPKKDVIAISTILPFASDDATYTSNVVTSRYLAADQTAYNSSEAVTKLPTSADQAVAQKKWELDKRVTLTDYKPTVDFNFNGGNTTYTPSVTALTTNNIFPNTIPVVDSLGKVIGFQSWIGSPYTGSSPIIETFKDAAGAVVNTTGTANFGLGKIDFIKTSCVKTLKIYAASVNWCESGKKAASSATRMDAWIVPGDTVFSQNNATAADTVDVAYPPTLTIKRDLVTNPVTATGCNYDTVVMQSSTTAINNYLPIKSAKWPAGTSGQLFWPTAK